MPILQSASAVAAAPAVAGEVELDPRRWLLLPVLLAGALLAPLDFFIVNVALPAIKAGLDMSAAQVQFVIAAYTIAYAVLLAIGGRLGDLYGRKRLFVGGMIGFGFASGLCGFAPTADVLILGRLLQGIMAAIMVPQVLATIQILFPTAERPRALGIFGAVFGFAAVAGQLAGGILVALHPFGLTWQAIFLVNLPICAVTAAAAAWMLPAHQPLHGAKPDMPGILLLTLTLLLLVYPAVEGREAGWPAWSFIAFAGVLPALAAFIQVERWQMARGRQPLVDLRLLGNPRFAIGLTTAMLFYVPAAFFLTYALYLQGGLAWAALPTAMAILPHGFGFLLGALTSPRLHRLDRLLLNVGFGLLVFGFAVMFVVVLTMGPGVPLYCGLFVAGFGQGIVMPTLARVVLHEAPAENAGLAAGLFNCVLQIGATLSVAIIGGVFFAMLGPRPEETQYAHAFAMMLACVVVANLICFALVLQLRPRKPANASGFETAKPQTGK